MFASTNYSRLQNIRADKILALTKYWRQHNLGFNKMLAHAWKHLLTVLARQSLQQLTSPRPHWCSLTSPWRCWSLNVQSPSVLLPLTILLLWEDSLPHCTGLLYQPAMQKMSQILASTNISARRDFTNFRQTIAVNISEASQASYQKLVKTKCDHHHCSVSVHIAITSKSRPSQRSNAAVSECPNGIGPMGRGGGEGEGIRNCPYHAKVREGCE
jgi:hypothetical protein